MQFGGKESKRHFTVVMGGKEHGLYVSSTPSSAAKKAVTKLCSANKSKKVEFSIREITQGSKKKTYGPYSGHIEKLKEPIELKGRVIMYKPVAKLSGKSSAKKGGMFRNPAAGPAQVNGNNSPLTNLFPFAGQAPVNSFAGHALVNSNNNDFFKDLCKYELITMIQFEELEGGEELSTREEELYENLDELKKLDRYSDIFDISIDNSSRNNVEGKPAKISVYIRFYNYSRDKEKEGFEEKLNELIELLKIYKNAADTGILHTEFTLNEPRECFSPEHNEFLRTLPSLIEPIKPTVNQNNRFRRVPSPKLPKNYHPGNAPPWNN